MTTISKSWGGPHIVATVGAVPPVIVVCAYVTAVSGVSGEIIEVCFHPINCPQKQNVADPEDCNKYFVCHFDKLYPRSCPPGTTFHQHVVECRPTEPSCSEECPENLPTSYKDHIVYPTTTQSLTTIGTSTTGGLNVTWTTATSDTKLTNETTAGRDAHPLVTSTAMSNVTMETTTPSDVNTTVPGWNLTSASTTYDVTTTMTDALQRIASGNLQRFC